MCLKTYHQTKVSENTRQVEPESEVNGRFVRMRREFWPYFRDDVGDTLLYGYCASIN